MRARRHMANIALSKARLMRLQGISERGVNLKSFIQMKTIKARIIRIVPGERCDIYMYEDVEAGECRMVPCWCLDDFAIFPSDAVDPQTQHLRAGANVDLVFDEAKGKTFPSPAYPRLPHSLKPDRKPLPEAVNIESWYDAAKPYAAKVTLNECRAEYVDRVRLGQVDAATQARILQLMMPPVNEAELLKALQEALGYVLPWMQESGTVEYKSSFFHHANPSKTSKDQFDEIISELASFANSHVCGKVYVGINRSGEIVNLADELTQNSKASTCERFEADFKNRVKQQSGSFGFMSAISFEWFKTQDNKLFCCISVGKWDGGIVILGNELWVRNESAKHLLRFNDLIDYIKKN